jgi:outer membrane protein OmpA-like peptidoglycan-associated protein
MASAALTMAALTMAALGVVAWALPGVAAAMNGAVSGETRPPPSAASRELDRVQALLLVRLATLPEGSGVLILRDHERLTLRIPARLLFEFDSARLRQGAAAAAPLAASVQVLRQHRRLHAQIAVYTDSIGGLSANQALSEQRAQAIYGALTAARIASDRLQPVGAGAASAVGGNDSPQGRIENRRVEIEFRRAERAGNELRPGLAAAP